MKVPEDSPGVAALGQCGAAPWVSRDDTQEMPPVAQFPCSRCHQRYRGPQQTAYPAIVNGVTSVRRRMRLCPDNFTDLSSWCNEHLVDGAQEIDFAVCCRCGKDPELPYAVFVTVYAAHEDRTDWWGRSCAACIPLVAETLFGTQEAFPEG